MPGAAEVRGIPGAAEVRGMPGAAEVLPRLGALAEVGAARADAGSASWAAVRRTTGVIPGPAGTAARLPLAGRISAGSPRPLANGPEPAPRPGVRRTVSRSDMPVSAVGDGSPAAVIPPRTRSERRSDGPEVDASTRMAAWAEARVVDGAGAA